MARAREAARIAVFTHDTFGLGHVRRCLHILGSLAESAPDTALLLITGSPSLQDSLCSNNKRFISQKRPWSPAHSAAAAAAGALGCIANGRFLNTQRTLPVSISSSSIAGCVSSATRACCSSPG